MSGSQEGQHNSSLTVTALLLLDSVTLSLWEGRTGGKSKGVRETWVYTLTCCFLTVAPSDPPRLCLAWCHYLSSAGHFSDSVVSTKSLITVITYSHWVRRTNLFLLFTPPPTPPYVNPVFLAGSETPIYHWEGGPTESPEGSLFPPAGHGLDTPTLVRKVRRENGPGYVLSPLGINEIERPGACELPELR